MHTTENRKIKKLVKQHARLNPIELSRKAEAGLRKRCVVGGVYLVAMRLMRCVPSIIPQGKCIRKCVCLCTIY